LLKVERLRSAYGRVQVLKDVNLAVDRAEVVALIGSNGAGKTTLLRAISGIQPISSGRIFFLGDDISRATAADRIAAGIAQCPEGRQVFAPLSVAANLRLGAYRRRARDIAADIERVYAMFPVLAEKRGTPAGLLSGGQQQMLAIGRALMAKPQLLLLDEPTLGLSPILIDRIFDTIRMLRESGMTILLVEQNAAAALKFADRAYLLETGSIMRAGPAREMLNDDAVRTAYLGM
jgi:branched-chain amino acid transport system ATP-binding protein